ncbi:MAG: hypothetical protein KGM16_19275 [Bacteroidota bacterium]|nr:hypothetical protein [Bacteroidota bacterium]
MKTLDTLIKENSNLEEVEDFSQKKLIALNFFFLGFIVYTLSYVIKGNPHIPVKIGELFQFIGILVFIPSASYLIRYRIKNNYLKVLFSFYLIWSIITIFRGIHLNYDSIKAMLVDANFGIFIYLAPLIILFPQKFIFYKKLFDVIMVLAISFLLFDILFIKQLLDRSSATQDVIEYLAKFLSIPCGYILITYKYHPRNRKLLAFGVMIISLLFALYKARRGLSLICGSILIFSYFLYLVNTKRVVITIYLSVLLVLGGAYYESSIYNINNNKLFSFIAKRGEEDTRTPVELYFYSDFKTNDWLIGRGINGEYYCPNIDEDQLTDYRSYIETGYLEFILKGGMIFLGLYLLMLIPALFLGLFYSKNILSKAAAIWIIVSLLALYPSTVNTFTLNFLLVWISAGICYSSELRNLSDNQIKTFLASIN